MKDSAFLVWPMSTKPVVGKSGVYLVEEAAMEVPILFTAFSWDGITAMKFKWRSWS